MMLEELKRKCEGAINYRGLVDLPAPAKIVLRLPENKKCPKRRRIFRQRGPMGDVVAWRFDGYDTVIFDAKEVLDYINGVLGVEEAKV